MILKCDFSSKALTLQTFLENVPPTCKMNDCEVANCLTGVDPPICLGKSSLTWKGPWFSNIEEFRRCHSLPQMLGGGSPHFAGQNIFQNKKLVLGCWKYMYICIHNLKNRLTFTLGQTGQCLPMRFPSLRKAPKRIQSNLFDSAWCRCAFPAARLLLIPSLSQGSLSKHTVR